MNKYLDKITTIVFHIIVYTCFIASTVFIVLSVLQGCTTYIYNAGLLIILGIIMSYYIYYYAKQTK